MTAQEMFEKMRYQRKENNNFISYLKGVEIIEFSKIYKEVDFCDIEALTIDEIEAINQQMIELEWIE